jgi:malonyl-CoA O-methyltransferase
VSFESFWRHLTGATRIPSPAPTALTPELRRQIRASFDEASHDEEHFPSTIDPRIQHVRVISKFFESLDNKCVLDIGCGKGRFARVFCDENPGVKIWGRDISEAMLRFVPDGIHVSAGTMTELPFRDASFDCVYATESLEHAVEIEKAVDEMCRVLKPGGKLAIIDKNAEHWGRMKTPGWERWFHRDEIEKFLAARCHTVSSSYLSYWQDVAPDGLFLVWFARK